MIELKHCILSQRAIVDNLSGQLSVIDIVNTLTVPSLPQTVNTLNIVMSWQRDRDEKVEACTFDTRTYLERADKTFDLKKANESTLSIPKDQYNINVIINATIKFTQEGENRIIVELKKDGKWKRVGSTSIEVVVASEDSDV